MMDSRCRMNNCRAMCPDTEPFCAKHRGEPHNRTDWFAGDVDCDGNELITVRKDEWNTICEQREKFMWQVRDTCTRAENAEARIEALQADVARLREADKEWVALAIRDNSSVNRLTKIVRMLADFDARNSIVHLRDIARQALKGSTDAE